jgi:Fe-S oxidoreductase
VHILQKAKVSFAVLGKDELCCGDPARRQGEEEIFQNIVRKNIEKLNGLGIKKIITMCPHCFNTMKRVYPEFDGNFQVQHATELLEQLIDEDRLELKYPIDKKITLHDPCYLGRVNNLTAGVRNIITAIPGIEFKELPRNKTNSYCCGGGGAQMWLHESPGDRISTLRVKEIIATGCKLTATACPYCLAMLGSEMKSCDESGEFKTMDVIDMAAYSIGCDCEG